jgi:excisionase family DNA binding protein
MGVEMTLFPKILQPWYQEIDLMAEGLLDAKEAANFLGIGRSKVYDFMASHKLPYVKLGKSRRIPKVALKIFAQKG